MDITLETPGVEGMGEPLAALREWQRDDAPLQLHPGDLGWMWRFGGAHTAAASRVWSRDGRPVAFGLLDEPNVLRLAIAPDLQQDEQLADRLLSDVGEAARGVLAAGQVYVAAPAGALVRDLLGEAGWGLDDPWTPLSLDLSRPVEEPGVRIEVVTPERLADRVAVQVASFERSTFDEATWAVMAAGPEYDDARCLIAYDEEDTAVAAVTVWSAGPGRPGLLEPLGTHRDHRGHGHGRAITLAAAAALCELGSSHATVCTPASNIGGVATYRSAGYQAGENVVDLCRGS